MDNEAKLRESSNMKIDDNTFVEEIEELLEPDVEPVHDFGSNQKNDKFSTKIFICIVITLFLFVASIFFLVKALDFRENREIGYKEVSNLDYKVCLKENSFFEDKCLDKDMLYVASLIDKLRFDFWYTFTIDQEEDIDFDYSIMATLKILDEGEAKTYYEKDYTLLSKKQVSLRGEKSKSINEKISIDYDYYNNIANTFKNNFGLNTTSKLDISFKIHKKTANGKDNFFASGDMTTLLVSVPLSQRSVQIKLDYKDINNQSSLVDTSKLLLNDIFFLVLAVILLILALILVIRIILILKLKSKKKSRYEVYIDKILREYDRVIAMTKTAPYVRENDKTIYVDSFLELLDVCDKTKEPILYYEVSKGEECNFYINHDDKVYLTVVRATDMEKQNEKN